MAFRWTSKINYVDEEARYRSLREKFKELNTFPKLLKWRARKYPDRVALRKKKYGIWWEKTWSQFYDEVRKVAGGLAVLGVRRGDVVVIIGHNDPEWIYAELGAQILGAIPLGIYPDSLPNEISYFINFVNAKVVVVEDQEQVEKILSVIDEVPDVEKVIYWDKKDMWRYRGNKYLMYFGELENLGHKWLLDNSGEVDENIDKTSPEEIAGLYPTSGTTGISKLAMLTYDNMINMSLALQAVDPMDESFEYVSYLPLPWIGEQMMSIATAFTAGFKVNFPEEPETVWSDFREIAPHVMFAPPRIWEDIVSDIMAKIEDSTWLKKKVYSFFMNLGYKIVDETIAKKRKPGLHHKILWFIGYWILYRSILDKYGLKRIRYAYTGGAMLGPHYFRFFHAIGVNLKQIYGQTEVSGIAVLHRDYDIKFETVGKPLPETKVEISDEGEILIKSRSVMKGYFKQPEKTKETIDENGWLHTGDAGFIDNDGHLVIVDRLSELFELSNGKKVPPQYIENMLKFSAYIKEAAVLGKGKPYCVALININFKNVMNWAEKRGIPFTSYRDLAQKPEVYGLVKSIIKDVNSKLPEHMRIRRFVILPKQFHADDGEVTRTRKIRRRFVAERYRELIDAMYRGERYYEFSFTMKLEDGRTTIFKQKIRIEEVK